MILLLALLSSFENALAENHYITCTCNTQNMRAGFCSCGDGGNGPLSGDINSYGLVFLQTDSYFLTCNGDGGNNEIVTNYSMDEQPSGVTCTILADTTFQHNQAEFECTNWNTKSSSIQLGSVNCQYSPPLRSDNKNN